MIVQTKSDGRALVEGRRTAHLAIGQASFFLPATKRFREGEGRKLYETLKRFVSSGDFEAILVSNSPLFLASCPRTEAVQWIRDHLEDSASCLLVLADAGSEGGELME